MQEEHDSSEEEEGFFKPQLRVVQSKESSPPHPDKPEEFSQANDLVLFNRPTDFQPRVLATSPPLYEQLVDLHLEVSQPREQLLPIHREKVRRCKYLSLSEKYRNNALFKAVYAKAEPAEFNSSIFSLDHTTDYSPSHYQQPLPGQEAPFSKFESRFESGNLSYAFLCLESRMEEYDLILQNDSNTKGYNQWFYFSFRNEASRSVRFNIVNLVKKHSLFEEGVRPVGFSLRQSHRGWRAVGSAVEYQKSYVSRQISSNPPVYKNYYTLSFTLHFEEDHDVTYLALNYPYTYSRLLKLLNELPQNHPHLVFDRSILAYSIANNAIPLLRIKHPDYKDGGKKILIMGRQHPGETVGSFVLEGFIKDLLKQPSLFKNYELLLIPMLNPDGVIYGNFRTNLAGFDLNRQWTDPNKWLHPEVYYVSKFIAGLENIAFVVDFHGHSKKYNSFIYACTGESPYLFRVFPYICGQQCELFSIKDCTYSITFDKERTARVKLYRQIKKPHVFTLETSFFGYTDNHARKFRFQIQDLYQTGEKISQSLKLFLLKKKEVLQYEKEVKEKEYLFDQWAFQNREDVDSESNPSEDELTPVQRKEKVLSEKTKKKGKSKSKLKKKKPREEKVNPSAEESKKKIAVEERKQPASEHSIKPALTAKPAQTIAKKKSESLRLVHFNEVKVNKKIHKALAVISPPPPKSSAPTIIPLNRTTAPKQSSASSTFELKHIEKVKEFELPTPANERKREESLPPPPPAPRNTSNLFNNTNYYAQMHEQLKREERKASLHQKTQSLEISNLKKEVIFPKGNTLNVLRKLISNEDDQNHKQREQAFLVRENRIVGSLIRAQEEEAKRSLEEEINSRTEALRNCQKKMREMSLDEPILRSDHEISLLQTGRAFPPAATPKAHCFPAIRLDRRLDSFNF